MAVIGPEESFFGGGGGERWASGQKERRERERNAQDLQSQRGENRHRRCLACPRDHSRVGRT